MNTYDESEVRQEAEGRRQEAEGRRQKAGGRRQKAGGKEEGMKEKVYYN